ncbi:unnamed protein product [Acanthosepion pharaonis]|uniref:Uncharacterized protein n=1 Tax=Acanthosepion pharaonis TaxID=158019 RepID=A0A812BQL6_ACAPH|nr:unnamed protein product [Sepia pharaonis]
MLQLSTPTLPFSQNLSRQPRTFFLLFLFLSSSPNLCSHCLSLSALQDSVIHQRNEPTQTDASEVLRATSPLRQFRKVPLKIPKSVRIPAADAVATAIDQALNLNSSLDLYHLFSFATLVLGIPYNKDPTSSVSSIMKNNISLFNSSKINATFFSYLSNSNRFHPSSTIDDSKRLRALVNSKLSKGDVSAADRVLASSDTILATTPEVLTTLRRKHPSPPSDVRFVQMEKKHDSNIEISKEAMVAPLKFLGSSSRGVEGLRPGHINDLISVHTTEAGEHLKRSITALINTLLRAEIHKHAHDLIFSANLTALKKKMMAICALSLLVTFFVDSRQKLLVELL